MLTCRFSYQGILKPAAALPEISKLGNGFVAPAITTGIALYLLFRRIKGQQL